MKMCRKNIRVLLFSLIITMSSMFCFAENGGLMKDNSKSEMALGYGSEFQLLRFLGHHRNYFNKKILLALNLPLNTDVYWLDYPSDSTRKSLDGELKDIECFKNESNYKIIKTEWEKFWPPTGSAQNWDGIFKIDNTWYFVEAKAHAGEIHNKTKASQESCKKITESFRKHCSVFSSCTETWISSSSYQLANRIAFIQFCKANGIDAKLVYINFINGYENSKLRQGKSVRSEQEWNLLWQEEYDELGLNLESLNAILTHVFIDCEENLGGI